MGPRVSLGPSSEWVQVSIWCRALPVDRAPSPNWSPARRLSGAWPWPGLFLHQGTGTWWWPHPSSWVLGALSRTRCLSLSRAQSCPGGAICWGHRPRALGLRSPRGSWGDRPRGSAPHGDPGRWPLCRLLQPHAQLRKADRDGRLSQLFAKVLSGASGPDDCRW